MDEGKLVVEAKNLTKEYKGFKAVDNLTLEIKEGEIFGFLGPNGAGKTTTILMFLGLTEPTSGTVRICGFDPVKEPLDVKKIVGYLPENVGFYDDMNAAQNLRYVARLNGIPDEISEKRIEELLLEVGLAGDKNKKVGTFSKGMRQRLGIAETLIKEPKVVFLDEPTIGLDPEGTNQMLDMIKSLSTKKGIAVFLTSHLLDQVQRICDRVGIMYNGNLIGVGTIDELAKEKLGLGAEKFTLEEIYMKFFKQGE
ncbi:MAG: ABC transporter ATP-binding protein [Syntrophorhabdaceae bacterium]|nr:ABC transporter ATP-binding protein [Syntrophorhabdaceae bacterium]